MGYEYDSPGDAWADILKICPHCKAELMEGEKLYRRYLGGGRSEIVGCSNCIEEEEVEREDWCGL